MMRTLIQMALDPQVGDRMFFSNQLRVMNGGVDAPSDGIKRKITSTNVGLNGKVYKLSSRSSTLTLTRGNMFDKYSPDLSVRDSRLNNVQKAIVYLAYHGVIEEVQELLVQGDI